MMLSRRGLLGWLGGGAVLLAAPAIVRASSLMAVKAWAPEVWTFYQGPLEVLYSGDCFSAPDGMFEIIKARIAAATAIPDHFLVPFA